MPQSTEKKCECICHAEYGACSTCCHPIPDKEKKDDKEIKNTYGGFDIFKYIGTRWLDDVDHSGVGTPVRVYYNYSNGEIKLFLNA